MCKKFLPAVGWTGLINGFTNILSHASDVFCIQLDTDICKKTINIFIRVIIGPFCKFRKFDYKTNITNLWELSKNARKSKVSDQANYRKMLKYTAHLHEKVAAWNLNLKHVMLAWFTAGQSSKVIESQAGLRLWAFIILLVMQY